MKITISTVIVALLSLLVVSNQAVAIDLSSFNGGFCQPYRGYEVGNFQYRYNGIKNVSNSSRWISCPLIEHNIIDNNNANRGTNAMWAYFTIPSGAKVTCYTYSNRRAGASWQQRWTTSRFGTGWLKLDGTGFTFDDYYGDYGNYCLLPAGATLNMIWVNEK